MGLRPAAGALLRELPHAQEVRIVLELPEPSGCGALRTFRLSGLQAAVDLLDITPFGVIAHLLLAARIHALDREVQACEIGVDVPQGVPLGERLSVLALFLVLPGS